ncbi:MAG: hemolysin III family protein [Mycobacterium sp.]
MPGSATTAAQDLPQALAGTISEVLGRPRTRGWIHLWLARLAIVAGAVLVAIAWSTGSARAGWATSIYAASIITMFSVSALYHRVYWDSPVTLKWFRRLDHSMIFVFIAGSFTPFALLAMPPATGTDALIAVWTGAAVGVALKMFWPSAPRWIGVPLYLLLGYVAIYFAEELWEVGGPAVVVLLVAGGVLYNIGVIFYAFRWPNPWPATFGYHEFFHAFTAGAATCHYLAVWAVVP